MSHKTVIPVNIAGTLDVPVDLTVLQTLRTDMMATGLHDQIVVEAVRLGVAGCLAGYDKVSIRRELKPPPPVKSANNSNSKKQSSPAQQQQQQQKQKQFGEYDEASAAKMLADSVDDKRALEEQAEALKGPATQGQAGPSSNNNNGAANDDNNNPFAHEQFTAEIDLRGLQKSIDRLITAFDKMADKVDSAMSGPLALLEKHTGAMPAEAVAAIVALKEQLQEAVASPKIEAPAAVPVASPSVVPADAEIEDEDFVVRRQQYRGGENDDDEDDDGQQAASDSDSTRSNDGDLSDPAAMGYAPLLDDGKDEDGDD